MHSEPPHTSAFAWASPASLRMQARKACPKLREQHILRLAAVFPALVEPSGKGFAPQIQPCRYKRSRWHRHGRPRAADAAMLVMMSRMHQGLPRRNSSRMARSSLEKLFTRSQHGAARSLRKLTRPAASRFLILYLQNSCRVPASDLHGTHETEHDEPESNGGLAGDSRGAAQAAC